jgi:hypothetical protein
MKTACKIGGSSYVEIRDLYVGTGDSPSWGMTKLAFCESESTSFSIQFQHWFGATVTSRVDSAIYYQTFEGYVLP